MRKLLKVAGVTSAAVVAGSFALANVHSGGDAVYGSREQSVVLAVTPPEHGPSAPVFDRAPAPPTIPPLPNRAPRLPILDLAGTEAGVTPAKRVQHAVADIKTPEPVKPIRQERERTPSTAQGTTPAVPVS